MKKAVPYLIIPLIFAALMLHHARGLVLCVCEDGKIVIETSCAESGCCSTASHADGDLHTEEGCRSCTQVPLAGNDALSKMRPTTHKTDMAFVANLAHQTVPPLVLDRSSALTGSTSLERFALHSSRISVLRI